MLSPILSRTAFSGFPVGIGTRYLKHIKIGRPLAKAVGEGAVPRAPRARMIPADENLRQIVIAGIFDRHLFRIVARQRRRLRTQFLGQLEVAQDAMAARLGQPLQGRGFDVNGVPWRFQPAGDTGRGADDLFPSRAGADAGEQGIPGLPDRRDELVAPVLQHLVVDPVGRAAQRQFAQGNQVALAEKVADRPFGLVGQIDLAGLQALQQLVRRQVNQHHLVGRIEYLVRAPSPRPGCR